MKGRIRRVVTFRARMSMSDHRTEFSRTIEYRCLKVITPDSFHQGEMAFAFQGQGSSGRTCRWPSRTCGGVVSLLVCSWPVADRWEGKLRQARTIAETKLLDSMN